MNTIEQIVAGLDTVSWEIFSKSHVIPDVAP